MVHFATKVQTKKLEGVGWLLQLSIQPFVVVGMLLGKTNFILAY